jgi:hypothetical protein
VQSRPSRGQVQSAVRKNHALNKWVNASSPPAEAPTPTMGKG